MNDYMKALYQQFFWKPDVTELEDEIETARREVRDCLDKLQRRRLMDLVDDQMLPQEEISRLALLLNLSWPGD